MHHLATESVELRNDAKELSSFLDSVGVQGVDTALLLLAILQSVGGIVMVKAVQSGRYVYFSDGAAQLFGRSPAELIGASDSELMGEDEAASLRKAEQSMQVRRTRGPTDHKLELDGQRREFSVNRVLINATHLCAVWLERTQEKHQEAQIKRALEQLGQQQMAYEQMRRELEQGSGRDPATGLYLRSQFEDQLRREVDLSTREHREFALVLIMLDPLKTIAMPPGARHSQIEGLGRLLRDNTRAMDAACRVGEEQFSVLLSGVGLATAHARMQQLLRQCTAQIVVFDGQDLGISVSIGVASFPHTASNQTELTQASEAALVDAQRRGGNRVALATIRFEAGSVG